MHRGSVARNDVHPGVRRDWHGRGRAARDRATCGETGRHGEGRMRRPCPFGARSVASARRHVTAPGATSHGVAASFRVFVESAYPAIGSGIPPRPSPEGGPRGLPRPRPHRSALKQTRRDPLLDFRAPSESGRDGPGPSVERPSLPWGSGPFSAHGVGSPLDPGLPHPVRSASRVSHPLDGFLLPAPSGPVSCRWRS
jgi:hypothetical protein